MRWFHSGVVAYAWPVEPVASSSEAVVVGLATGTRGLVPVGYPEDKELLDEQAHRGEFRHVERVWDTTNCLHVFQTGQWWGTRLMWDAPSGDFLCWYVDFLRPVVSHGTFVDSRDLSLDIVVFPDGSMLWKDEDRYAEKVDAGLISEDERLQVEVARAHAVDAIEARRFPFDGAYLDWTPDGQERSLPADALRTE